MGHVELELLDKSCSLGVGVLILGLGVRTGYEREWSLFMLRCCELDKDT